MGFTQGKRPSGAKIGKVHKIMSGNTVVFRDATSSLGDLIARAQENPLRMTLADVAIEEPGHPIEGENWRPQLAPYKPWVHDAALDEVEEFDGTDGDLLIVGALGMGITDEERMGLIGSAVRGEGGEGSVSYTHLTLPTIMLAAGLQRRWPPRASFHLTSCGRWGRRRAGRRGSRRGEMQTRLATVKQ